MVAHVHEHSPSQQNAGASGKARQCVAGGALTSMQGPRKTTLFFDTCYERLMQQVPGTALARLPRELMCHVTRLKAQELEAAHKVG